MMSCAVVAYPVRARRSRNGVARRCELRGRRLLHERCHVKLPAPRLATKGELDESLLRRNDAEYSRSRTGWFRCIYGLRAERTESRPANRFSCNGTFPVGPERSVTSPTASSERKLMLMDAMSEFEASNGNCRIGKQLEALH